MKAKKRKSKLPPSHNDIGFDSTNHTVAISKAGQNGQRHIVEHPDAKPILVIAELNGDIGIRVYGPPSLELADNLDAVARQYRKAVEMALAKPQG
jgi:6-phosphogluconolactonase (cycloisomerase 2 family)